MTDESLIAYLVYYYHYTPDGAQALIDRNGDHEKRRNLEEIVDIKRFPLDVINSEHSCLSY